MTSKQRIFKSLFQYLDPIIAEGLVDVTKEPAYKETWAIYSKLENSLYPWIKPFWKNVFEINMTIKQDKGIVMCVGEDQFKHAASAVRALREVLKSGLPIEIFYINQYDLSKSKRDYFETFENVKTVDISTLINDEYTQFGGWAIKPYAMLASSFRHVILMDADVFMFQKPDTLFEDEGYKRTGALFFLDRTLFNNYEDGHRWLKSFLPTYSTYVEQSRWWKKTSAHEQESGIVVMDKKKVLFGLLSTCKMNDKQERDKVSYRHSHGDKEVTDQKLLIFFLTLCNRHSGLVSKWFKHLMYSLDHMVQSLEGWVMLVQQGPCVAISFIWIQTRGHGGGMEDY